MRLCPQVHMVQVLLLLGLSASQYFFCMFLRCPQCSYALPSVLLCLSSRAPAPSCVLRGSEALPCPLVLLAWQVCCPDLLFWARSVVGVCLYSIQGVGLLGACLPLLCPLGYSVGCSPPLLLACAAPGVSWLGAVLLRCGACSCAVPLCSCALLSVLLRRGALLLHRLSFLSCLTVPLCLVLVPSCVL